MDVALALKVVRIPRYGDSAVVQGGLTHFADQLTPEMPMARDGNMSWTGEIGTYAWGAVSPEVGSVVVEIGSRDQTIEAVIAGGYFLAILGPELPCCLFTAVALDADGKELARAE